MSGGCPVKTNSLGLTAFLKNRNETLKLCLENKSDGYCHHDLVGWSLVSTHSCYLRPHLFPFQRSCIFFVFLLILLLLCSPINSMSSPHRSWLEMSHVDNWDEGDKLCEISLVPLNDACLRNGGFPSSLSHSKNVIHFMSPVLWEEKTDGASEMHRVPHCKAQTCSKMVSTVQSTLGGMAVHPIFKGNYLKLALSWSYAASCVVLLHAFVGSWSWTWSSQEFHYHKLFLSSTLSGLPADGRNDYCGGRKTGRLDEDCHKNDSRQKQQKRAL